MSEPVFTRVTGTSLFLLASSQTVSFAASVGSGLGNTATLSQTWGDAGGGSYVLLGAPPVDVAVFAAALTPYLQSFGGGPPRIIWIVNPSDPSMEWRGTPLFAAPTQPGSAVWRTRARTDFPIGSYAFSLAGQALLALATEQQGWGFTLSATAPASLTAPGRLFPSRDSVAVFTFAAGAVGTWRFSFDVPSPAGGPSGLQQLEAGLRYFAPSTSNPDFVTTIRLDALKQGASVALALDAYVDPLRVLDPTRTHFDFLAVGNVMPPLQSAFATARGYAIDLTPATAQLVFAIQPLQPGGPDSNIEIDYYLVPNGSFKIAVKNPPNLPADVAFDRLLLGASGLEYIALPLQGDNSLYFHAGQPAYVMPPADGRAALDDLGTTAWAYVGSTTGNLDYFAQPEDAPLYSATAAQTFLPYLEMRAASLPAPGTGRPFPVAPYRGLDPSLVPEALEIERAALVPVRRAQIAAAVNGTVPLVALAEQVGVTPQGLAVGVSDQGAWSWIGIGNDIAGTAPNLRFTNIGPRLRAALQSSELFLVLANPDTFLADSSVAYQLTQVSLAVIAALPPGQGVPLNVWTAVSNAFRAAGYPLYANETTFTAALQQASPGITVPQQLVFERYAGQLTVTVESWKFLLSPRNWISPDGSRTALVMLKFATGRSIREFAGDLASWTWPEAAARGGDAKVAQAQLLAAIADAQELTTGNDVYARFLRVVDDRAWNGVLSIDCEVPMSGLPDALKMLAAGIEVSRFKAHHVGVSATPFQTDPKVTFNASSIFGLIDYRNPDSQYFDENVHYLFRVSRLSVGFRNSVVAEFESAVQLLLNRLLGVKPILYPTDAGNSLTLAGVYQRQRGRDGVESGAYLFSLSGPAMFSLPGSAVQTADFLGAQLVLRSLAAGQVGATFQFSGRLRFYRPERFDPFCWGPVAVGPNNRPVDEAADGYLAFTNYSIDMAFSLGDPQGSLVWTAHEAAVAFDLTNSKARPDSLAASFPVHLTGLSATPGTLTPADLGYVAVSAPIEQGALTTPWYGLVYELDLGDLGALAESAGISLRILAGWSAGTGRAPAIYVGVRLPGLSDALGIDLPLQGVLNLGFRAIQFTADDGDDGRRSYALRFRDFALRILGLSFPPGHNDVYLVGSPAGPASSAQLGWYAAYSKDESNKPQRRADRRALLAVRSSIESP
jgi:hypothetical protein